MFIRLSLGAPTSTLIIYLWLRIPWGWTLLRSILRLVADRYRAHLHGVRVLKLLSPQVTALNCPPVAFVYDRIDSIRDNCLPVFDGALLHRASVASGREVQNHQLELMSAKLRTYLQMTASGLWHTVSLVHDMASDDMAVLASLELIQWHAQRF
ncbi:hypothetical protein A0H81_04887 [Grifola frondosa]|uniref:Uncharacterized protein n=1 Tax=Grifola frondosa TaxID=5627 RepID=A0A1C7MFC3_GRIFR|nr:hypothetical protein A0H81_04887 [Grifola frondosa]